MTKINAEAYNAGKRDFKRGTTLLALVEAGEPPKVSEANPDFNYTEFQNAHLSRCLGFADAALEWLRGGMRR